MTFHDRLKCGRDAIASTRIPDGFFPASGFDPELACGLAVDPFPSLVASRKLIQLGCHVRFLVDLFPLVWIPGRQVAVSLNRRKNSGDPKPLSVRKGERKDLAATDDEWDLVRFQACDCFLKAWDYLDVRDLQLRTA